MLIQHKKHSGIKKSDWQINIRLILLMFFKFKIYFHFCKIVSIQKLVHSLFVLKGIKSCLEDIVPGMCKIQWLEFKNSEDVVFKRNHLVN